MDKYRDNLMFLKKNAYELYNKITNSEKEFEFEETFLPATDNYYIETQSAGCFLHSIYDRNNEMNNMFRRMSENTEVVVLFGIGCGDAIEYLLKSTGKVRYVIVIEPMIPVFKHFLEKYRISDLSKVGKFTFILNTRGERAYITLKQALISSLMDNIFFAYHVSYRTIFKDYFDAVKENVFRLIRLEKTILCSNFVNYKLNAVNYISNLKIDCLPVDCLKDIFKGRPAVIVSAGPSLNKNISYLRKMKEKAVILAVGSAIKILDKNKITPHFRVAYDWTNAEKDNIFDGLTDTNVPLIFTDQLYHEILQKYQGKKFRMLTLDSYIPMEVLKRAGIECEYYYSGISIANIALALLCKMGCSHIIFTGQDMCLANNKLYADGCLQTSFGETDPNLIEVNDIYGNKTYSIIQYLQIKYELEEVIVLHPEIKYINSTEGGIGLKDVANMNLSEAYGKELKNDLSINIDDHINSAYSKQNVLDYNFKVSQGIESYYSDINKILEISEKIINIYSEVNFENKYNKNFIWQTYQKRLYKLENALESSELYRRVIKRAIGSILKSITYKKKNNNEDDYNEAFTYIDAQDDLFKKAASIYEYCLISKHYIERKSDNIYLKCEVEAYE